MTSPSRKREGRQVMENLMGSPIQITLYSGEDDAEKKTYTRSIIPWRVLKKAVKLQAIDAEHLTEENVDDIAALVVEVFGDQFTLDELNDGAEVGEMLSVVRSIVSRAAQAIQANPTQTQTPRKK